MKRRVRFWWPSGDCCQQIKSLYLVHMCSFAILLLPSCLCVLRFCGGLKAFGREGEFVVVIFFFAFVFIELWLISYDLRPRVNTVGQETKSHQRVRHWIELLTSVFINRTRVLPLTLVILNWKFNWPECLCKILVLIRIFEETDGQYQYWSWSNQCILKSSQSNGRRKHVQFTVQFTQLSIQSSRERASWSVG